MKKRAKYENEVLKCETKFHAIPIAYGDRFIPRRQNDRQSMMHSRNSTDDNDNDILSVKKQPFYWRLHNYRITIGNQLGLVESTRLLNFHDATTMRQNSYNSKHPFIIEQKVPSKSVEALDWPCKPRAKPLA